jgi:hypothetical protein
MKRGFAKKAENYLIDNYSQRWYCFEKNSDSGMSYAEGGASDYTFGRGVRGCGLFFAERTSQRSEGASFIRAEYD